jgi:DNA-binding transcriptional ArsR family regulator
VPKPSLTPELLELVAHRFKVLAEPARLAILNSLRARELTVSDIVDQTGLGQANVSKHLQLLYSHGFITRRKDGLYAYYALADRRVFTLCDLMCDSLQDVAKVRRRLLAS